MRKEDFDRQMGRAWDDHRGALRSAFKAISPRSSLVHQLLMDLQHRISVASGEKVTYHWGPAQYDLAADMVTIPYRITCEEIARTLEFSLIYQPDGTHLGDRSFDIGDEGPLTVAVTQMAWETFQPPQVRRQPIHAPPPERD